MANAQLQHHLDTTIDAIFNTLEGLPFVRTRPKLVATLESYKTKAKSALDAIEAKLPNDHPTVQQIVDAVFAVIEEGLPNTIAGFFERQTLEMLRMAIDALLASPPVPAPQP